MNCREGKKKEVRQQCQETAHTDTEREEVQSTGLITSGTSVTRVSLQPSVLHTLSTHKYNTTNERVETTTNIHWHT